MEELDFQGLLDKFNTDGFQKGEQIILANFGTNQTLLSLIFQTPVNIKLINQREEGGVILRQVELRTADTLTAYATTHIPKSRNRGDVLLDITAGKMGLGQIVVIHNLPNRRSLVNVGRDKAAFWRTYTIEGPELFLEIHEHFPREPFEAIGWIKKEMQDG